MDITSYLLGKKASGGGEGPNWKAIGYDTTPSSIVDKYNDALDIKNNWDSTITTMSEMYENNKDLFIFPSLDFSNITGTSKTFKSCTNLIEAPYFNTPELIICSNMFEGCSNLVKVGGLDLSNCATSASIFQNCSKLKIIGPITGLQVSKTLPNLSKAFWECNSLETAPYIDTSKYSNLSNMFYGCDELKNVPIYDMTNVYNGSNGWNLMFYGCPKLTDESLNNIMASLLTASKITKNKYLTYIGLSNEQAERCASLSNWEALEEAGWTTTGS